MDPFPSFPGPPRTSGPHLPVSWGARSAALGVLALIVVELVAAGVLILVLWLLSTPADEAPLWAVLGSTLVLQLGMLAVAFLFGPFRRGPVGQLLGHRRLPTVTLFLWGAIAFGASVVISAVYFQLVGSVREDLIPDPLPGGIDFEQMRWLSFVSIAVIAPFSEEVFFRGFLFAGLAKRYGFWVGAVLSGLVFALVHLEFARTVPALLSGIVFAGVYWRTGSVWPSVLAHTAQNAIALGLAFNLT